MEGIMETMEKKYHVSYLDDNGGTVISRAMDFDEAIKYKGTIAYSRKPAILMDMKVGSEHPRTKGDLARQMGLKTFDFALPQNWVNRANERGFDVVPHFVWSYDDAPIGGVPMPLTKEGWRMLQVMAMHI